MSPREISLPESMQKAKKKSVQSNALDIDLIYCDPSATNSWAAVSMQLCPHCGCSDTCSLLTEGRKLGFGYLYQGMLQRTWHMLETSECCWVDILIEGTGYVPLPRQLFPTGAACYTLLWTFSCCLLRVELTWLLWFLKFKLEKW